MSRTPGRKGRRECRLATGETGMWVPTTIPAIYMYIYISDTDKPFLVDRKSVLILHKYFEIKGSVDFI